ncbi:Uncharacterised protein [Campylobacter hyointestinalis subsp. hyointestinalis]|uniref:Uncharacterized protein n=1 Tax=Campylobacter hyointestinalis subsp. hyointestinalis TaxID=91352 RepID=A0A0S4STR7_CAMHY|nr:hypothetical protein [Campylobacter hyointestinalis]CUU89838.1 Uncharacterised protein [Campylobacter hyointestinalis subsp. hyointestinalis]
MAIFKEKKQPFAFVDLDNKQDNKQNNLNEFISSGAGDKKLSNNSDKKGRPRAKEKLARISLYVTEEEKVKLIQSSEDLHMTLSSFIRFKIFS